MATDAAQTSSALQINSLLSRMERVVLQQIVFRCRLASKRNQENTQRVVQFSPRSGKSVGMSFPLARRARPRSDGHDMQMLSASHGESLAGFAIEPVGSPMMRAAATCDNPGPWLVLATDGQFRKRCFLKAAVPIQYRSRLPAMA